MRSRGQAKQVINQVANVTDKSELQWQIDLERYWNKWSRPQQILFIVVVSIAIASLGYLVFFYLPKIIYDIENLYFQPVQPIKYKDELDANNVSELSFRPVAKWPFFNASLAQLSSLPNLINKIKIHYDSSFNYKLSWEEQFRFEEIILQMSVMIRKNLPYVLNSVLLSRILSDPNFSIYIMPASMIGAGSADGSYDPETNRIFLAWDPYKTEESLRRVLRNEFHHAAIRYQNLAKKDSRMDLLKFKDMRIASGTPAINNYFQVNYMLVNRLDYAIKRGLERIQEEYKSVIEKAIYQIPLNKTERNKLDVFLDTLKDYDIQTLTVKISKEKYAAYQSYKKVVRLADDRLFIPAGKYSDTRLNSQSFFTAWMNWAPAFSEFEFDNYLRLLKEDDRQVKVAWQHAKDNSLLEKAKAFITEFTSDLKMYDPEGPYGQTTKGNIALKLLELSSHIEEFPEALKKLVFPEWCQYFDDYMQIKDYCDRNTPQSATLR